jgi:hypothetical protein
VGVKTKHKYRFGGNCDEARGTRDLDGVSVFTVRGCGLASSRANIWDAVLAAGVAESVFQFVRCGQNA